ncbi:MAG: ribosome modulation factor [Gammaproteobacteria bacterium]|nr:ribosome modulation factor [Gammaproteobacteria bacterium]
MNRQKRDRSTRAYSKGHKAGTYGHSKDSCPYNTTEQRQVWLGGWREGCEEAAAGFMVR